MRFWAVLVSADRYGVERLYEHDSLVIASAADFASAAGFDGAPGPAGGDRVALVADIAPPVVFALCTAEVMADHDPDDPGPGRRSGATDDDVLTLTYTHRLFDEPRRAAGIVPTQGPIREITAAAFEALVPAPTASLQRSWLVSVDLPIEAASPAEAVRQFWTYVRELGPAELPAFVRPSDDELALQAYVRGEPANLDPEEDG
jgi:hypothetical protein